MSSPTLSEARWSVDICAGVGESTAGVWYRSVFPDTATARTDRQQDVECQ